MRLTTSQITEVTNGELIGEEKEIAGVTQDSRNVTGGCLFVPLISERDGHSYINNALLSGAAAYLTQQNPMQGTAIRVENTSVALKELGQAARFLLKNSVIGITGSVGKTSVKDMAHAVLSKKTLVHSSPDSYNNEIGVPLTLLNTPNSSHCVIVEMGAKKNGDISSLCKIAYPDIAVITTVVDSHIQDFGSIDNIAETKGEILDRLPSEGCAILNADVDQVISQASRTRSKVLTFGNKGEVKASSVKVNDDLKASFLLESPWGRIEVNLNVAGSHMVTNAEAAAAIGLVSGVPLSEIAQALNQIELSPGRMEITSTVNGATLINDSYNANPTSMKAGIASLASSSGVGRKIAVVGLMAELGEKALISHTEVRDYADQLGIELLAVDTDLYGTSHTYDVEEVISKILEMELKIDDALLVKASRVAGLERIVKAISRS